MRRVTTVLLLAAAAGIAAAPTAVADADTQAAVQHWQQEGPDVYVAPVDDSFCRQYAQLASHVSRRWLKHPFDIKRGNRMSLRLFRRLRRSGFVDVPGTRLQLYTAKGAGARVNAVTGS